MWRCDSGWPTQPLARQDGERQPQVGVLRRLFTRIYFADEEANAADPILALVPADRRDTLIARREERDGGAVYIFDVRLQGAGETVFFEA